MRHPVVEEDLAAICSADLDWERLAGRTVLVTGANGLVGSSLAEALLYRNELRRGAPTRVVGLVRNGGRAAARFAAYVGRADLEIIVQDASEPVRISGPVDYVLHAAGQASPRHFSADPVGTYMPNTLGTHNLLALADEQKSEGFLFVSSGAVYGSVSGPSPITETTYGVVDPLDVKSCYAESKRMGETMCRAWHHQHGVPARIARLGHTYGPNMRRDDDRAFAEFVFCIVEGRDILLNSAGTTRRFFSYITDTTIGLLRVLLDGRNGEAYTVANPGAESSILDLAQLLTELYPARGSIVRVNAAPRPQHYLPNTDEVPSVDITKMRELGWTPVVDLPTGFRRTIASYL